MLGKTCIDKVGPVSLTTIDPIQHRIVSPGAPLGSLGYPENAPPNLVGNFENFSKFPTKYPIRVGVLYLLSLTLERTHTLLMGRCSYGIFGFFSMC